MEYVIETKNLVKRYKNRLAINKINMHVKKGSIYGFIGKNGAGKTTTMRAILGLTNLESGSVKLFGSNDLVNARKKIGSLIEAPGLYRNYSAYENMKRIGYLVNTNNDEIINILKLVGLDPYSKKKSGEFSLGMRQRLGIAMSLIGNPELLILDEPINGLDPEGIKEIRDIIIDLNKSKGITFLISSHLLDELSKVVSDYGIINNGYLIEEISKADLQAKCLNGIDIVVNDVNKTIKILKQITDKDLIVNNNEILINDLSIDIAKLNLLLNKNNILVSKLILNESSFENYFIERLGK